MPRLSKEILTETSKTPYTRPEIIERYCRGKSVLDIGCVQHDIINSESNTWLHQTIVDTADSVLGIDYLSSEVDTLRKRGYNVIQGDVTKPLEIDQKFDVIVAGNLIEHLSNFEGFLMNITRLLTPNGVALIGTANPFFMDQYFYSAFKNDVIVNPEHTCWIDPVTLNQLATRFGLTTEKVLWIKEKWALQTVIKNGKDATLDTFTGRWTFHSQPSVLERAFYRTVKPLLEMALGKKKVRQMKSIHGNATDRIMYMRLTGKLFDVFWHAYQKIIPTSDINRHELFISVLKKDTARHSVPDLDVRSSNG